MKKYARLRSSTLVTEQCEPCGRKPSEVPTTVALGDDIGTTAAPKWKSSSSSSSNYVCAAAASSKRDQGEDVSSSASHRALAEALKKLSSLRETKHEDYPELPRGANSTHWGARNAHSIDADAANNKPAINSSSFSAGKWPRLEYQSAGAAEQGGSHKSRRSRNVGAATTTALGSMGITRTESCAHTTHRRSSSMHDIVLSQPASWLAPMAAIHKDQDRRRRAGSSGILVPPGFPDEEESGWPSPQLRCSTSSAAAATTTPSGRQLPADPLQTSCRLWEEEDYPQHGTGRSAAKRANGVQSMRYDRWQGGGPAGWMAGDDGGAGKLEGLEPSSGGGRAELQSQSLREGAAHASAIAAIAQAYAEKYGVAQAVVECVSCGRGLGVIVEGNSPGSYDSSFCRSCRPLVLPMPAAVVSAAASSSSKKGGGAGGLPRGMMQYCRKLLLRMGKKPSHKYTLV